MPARNIAERRKVLRFSNQEVVIALAVAGFVKPTFPFQASGRDADMTAQCDAGVPELTARAAALCHAYPIRHSAYQAREIEGRIASGREEIVIMVMMASSAFHTGHPDVAQIETAYHTLTPLLGSAAAGVFLLSLIASGLSSSTGQMIMQASSNSKSRSGSAGL
jgi:Mn2+/Fe2+ NRAMP family transporter